MELYEIENPEWEENIKYYFSAKELYNKDKFFDIIKSKEKIEFDLIKSKVAPSESILEKDDFLLKKVLDWRETIIFLLNDDWNYKIILIETNCDYILKIWSTSA